MLAVRKRIDVRGSKATVHPENEVYDLYKNMYELINSLHKIQCEGVAEERVDSAPPHTPHSE